MYRNKVLALVVFLLFLASFHDSSFADIDSVTVSNPILKDADGNVASSLNSGQQASIFVTIENNEATSHPFTAIIELRDVDGVTFDLQWQTGTLEPSGTQDIEVSWIANFNEPAEISARVFVISGLKTR